MVDNRTMADYMHDALSKLLDVYDARRRGDLERESKAKEEEARFLSDFAELRRDVIRPVFEAAGAMLEERGHRYSIAEQEFMAGPEGRISEAGITLRIVPSGTKAPLREDQRSLSITTRHYNKTVWINSGESAGSGGIAGAKGAHALEKVTRQLVEEELIGFVARVVAS
jgi:hypothetical protein